MFAKPAIVWALLMVAMSGCEKSEENKTEKRKCPLGAVRRRNKSMKPIDMKLHSRIEDQVAHLAAMNMMQEREPDGAIILYIIYEWTSAGITETDWAFGCADQMGEKCQEAVDKLENTVGKNGEPICKMAAINMRDKRGQPKIYLAKFCPFGASVHSKFPLSAFLNLFKNTVNADTKAYIRGTLEVNHDTEGEDGLAKFRENCL